MDNDWSLDDTWRNATQLIKQQQDSIIESVEKKNEKERLYKQAVVDALKGIEKNTANLTEIVSLLHYSNEKQDEIFNIIMEILSIAKSENQEKAESKYRQVMNRISNFTGDVEQIQKLMSFLTTMWTILHTSHII